MNKNTWEPQSAKLNVVGSSLTVPVPLSSPETSIYLHFIVVVECCLQHDAVRYLLEVFFSRVP